MVDWYADGTLSHRWNSTVGLIEPVYFASPGAVDLGFKTRLQYNKAGNGPGENGSEVEDTIFAVARLTFTDLEVLYVTEEAAADPPRVRRLTATMFVCPSWAVSSNPDIGEIVGSGATTVYRSTQSTVTAGEDRYLGITGPRAGTLTPGTKYWVALVPTVPIWTSTPSVANDTIVNTFPNAKGRALSFWMNRPPVKPTLVEPLATIVQVPGSKFRMGFNSDADADYKAEFSLELSWNICGVQLQRAPTPPDGQSPVWTNCPITTTYYDSNGQTNEYSNHYDDGWFISGANPSGSASATGAIDLMQEGGIDFYPGGTDAFVPAPAGHVFGGLNAFSGVPVPSGDWMFRMRTFDPGGEGYYYAANFNNSNYSPTNYPGDLISPWSDTFRVIVPKQVPPPMPLYPINSVALPVPQPVTGNPVTLTWQYRNTYQPPYPQASRTVQIREVGTEPWFTFTSAGASPSYTFSTAESQRFVPGKMFEWRVSATDSKGVTSDYSESAFFWVVAAPISGVTRPIPTASLDGASLGLGVHRAFVYRRGGKQRVGELGKLSHVDWSRVRDDISTAQVQVSEWSIDGGNMLAELQTWAYELVIFRDNGFSTERVWEGPITLITYEVDKVTIDAKDVMAYAYRRIVKQKMNDKGATVIDRATRVLQNAFAPDDPNVLGYLTPMIRDDDAKQYRSLPPYSRTAFEEVDDMAANAGLDYTTIGRRIMLWGTKHRIGTLPEFRDSDLGAPPIVSEYGMSFANRYAVSDGNGIWGEATRLDPVSQKDETYGLVEMLSSSWASESEEDTGSYTQAGIETIRESFTEYAERSIADRYPPPVVVRVPDNTTINPDAVLSIQQLVPGVVIPLRSTGTLRQVVASQKLDAVKVVEASDRETISITLSPFSRDDVVIPEE